MKMFMGFFLVIICIDFLKKMWGDAPNRYRCEVGRLCGESRKKLINLNKIKF